MNNAQYDPKLFSELYDVQPQAIVWMRPIWSEDGSTIKDFEYTYCNEAGLQYLNLTREQQQGLRLSHTPTLTDPLRKSVLEEMIAVYQTGIKSETSSYNPVLNKHFLVLRTRLRDGVLTVVQERFNIITDVPSTKEAHLVLARSEKLLQTIINRTQSGILVAAPVVNEQGKIIDFRFVMANRTLAAYVHQEPEMLIGELGSKWFSGYMTNGLFELFCDTYLNGKTNRIDYHYNADGIDAWIDLMCTQLEDTVLITFTDYTPFKTLQLQMEGLVEELRRSNQNLEEFAHAASHDLKEPIRKILVFSERLKQSLGNQLNEGERGLFERMQHAAQRMGLLVDDLLMYSHVSQTPVEQEEIDLNEKLRTVLADLEVQIEEKNAAISVGRLPTVKGYRRQLQQLFQNLLSNALKYSKQGIVPRISVRSRVVSGAEVPYKLPEESYNKKYHLIEVCDNGIGFEQQYADKIFQMFQRLHGRSEYSGTGVGLSIVRKVVENHHGFIWAESEPDKGARFYVLLPA